MKNIYVLIFAGLADWEIGLITYELNTNNAIPVTTVGLTSAPIKTGGGLTILPDVTLVEIDPQNTALLMLPGGEMWHTVSHESRKKHAARALRERLSDEKYAQVPIEILFGDPGHEITDFAERVRADLIVMPSHGRTGLSRLLIGSVAERVIRLAHCPVLVLRDQIR